MEIKLLKLLDPRQGQSISQLAVLLKINSITTLRLIASINTIQLGLIINQNGKYFLTKALNWLAKDLIQTKLNAEELNYSVTIVPMLDSSNSYILRHLEQLSDKSIVSCEWQNAGRGRFGRHWIGKIAHDLTLSVLYIFPLDFKITLLPMLAAVAVNRLLKNHSLKNQIKWPNDIYVKEEKVAGILVENLIRNQQNNTVIGIGLNNFANWERNGLVVELISSLDRLISEYKMFGFALLRREWLDNCLHLNKQVSIHQNGSQIAQGIHKDISENGELIIDTANGRQTYSSSAISLLID